MTKDSPPIIHRAPFLVGKRLYLRAPEPQDAPFFQRAISDPQTRKWLQSPFPLSLRQEQELIAGWNPPKHDHVIFSIVLKKRHELIGNMGLVRIDWINRKAESAALLGLKKHRGLGYAAEAKELLLEYAFSDLGLHRIESRAMATNTRSIAYLKKSGYSQEGLQRQSIFRDGQWVDLAIFSILEHEWRKRNG